MLQTAYLDISFDYTVSTYPPANYYPDTILNIFDGFSAAIRGLALTNLVVAICCYFGVRKTVFYALETVNLLAILYVTQGYGLNGFIDWVGYSIVNMKEAALVGGFSIGDCICPADSFHATFGYQDQFTQNGGIVLVVFLCLLVVYSLLFLILKCYKLKNKPDKQNFCYLRVKLWQYYFKYFLYSIILTFNANMIFSGLIQLYGAKITSTTSAINIFLSVLVVVGYITYLVVYFSWSRSLRIGYVHPDEEKSRDAAVDLSVKSSEERGIKAIEGKS